MRMLHCPMYAVIVLHIYLLHCLVYIFMPVLSLINRMKAFWPSWLAHQIRTDIKITVCVQKPNDFSKLESNYFLG